MGNGVLGQHRGRTPVEGRHVGETEDAVHVKHVCSLQIAVRHPLSVVCVCVQCKCAVCVCAVCVCVCVFVYVSPLDRRWAPLVLCVHMCLVCVFVCVCVYVRVIS